MIIGIDIGLSGALAVLDDSGNLLEMHDMPCLADGPKGRRTLNAGLLSQIVEGIVANAGEIYAIVEMVTARPGEGAVGAFSFGRSRGIVEGILAAYGVPCRFVTPAKWKRVLDIPVGHESPKDMARSLAIKCWPEQADKFARVKDDGWADASLIALAGLQMLADKGGAVIDYNDFANLMRNGW